MTKVTVTFLFEHLSVLIQRISAVAIHKRKRGFV